jgi:hypothetical protein
MRIDQRLAAVVGCIERGRCDSSMAIPQEMANVRRIARLTSSASIDKTPSHDIRSCSIRKPKAPRSPRS